MQKGDIVSIYQNPMTGTNYEGEAELVSKERETTDTESWLVRFVGFDDGEFYRTIAVDKERKPLFSIDKG